MGLTGWYVHHHGAGHLTRFSAVRPHLPGEVVVFSSLPRPEVLPGATGWIRLPRDDDQPPGTADPAESDPTAGGLLHWAPLGHIGHKSRFAIIASVLGRRQFDRFVIDVSVEVTLLARLFGIPVVVVTQPGDRDDCPHQLAHSIASRVLAPWPAGAHPGPRTPALVEVGGISRFDGRTREVEPDPGRLLVLGGSVSKSELAAAAAATPGTRWQLAGSSSSTWIKDPWEALQRAEIVITAAGQNSIADVAAAGARAIVVPQPRPFDEQWATGRVLADRRLAVVEPKWPNGHEWPSVLEKTRRLQPDWTQWQVAGAARRAAAAIAQVGR